MRRRRRIRVNEYIFNKNKINNEKQTCEQTNLKSGYFFIKRTAVAKLRPHFLTVSATGHNHAEHINNSLLLTQSTIT